MKIIQKELIKMIIGLCSCYFTQKQRAWLGLHGWGMHPESISRNRDGLVVNDPQVEPTLVTSRVFQECGYIGNRVFTVISNKHQRNQKPSVCTSEGQRPGPFGGEWVGRGGCSLSQDALRALSAMHAGFKVRLSFQIIIRFNSFLYLHSFRM